LEGSFSAASSDSCIPTACSRLEAVLPLSKNYCELGNWSCNIE
jgi:hypothetical protein